MNRAIPAFVVAAILASTNAYGEWLSAKGEFFFGPNLSQNEACQRAESRAVENALMKGSGERISYEDLMVCSEVKDSASCNMNQHTWRMIGGRITGKRNKKMDIMPGPAGSRKCRITLDVNVEVGSGKPDPGFDMTVRLNQKTFRSGEKLKIKISPNQPMYVSVFQWLPYRKADHQVSRIFPNLLDKNNKFDKPNSVPTTKGGQLYDMMVAFPDNLESKLDMIDEYLMVVGTRNPIKFRKTYSPEEFNARLMEIPRNDWRNVEKAYNVMRVK